MTSTLQTALQTAANLRTAIPYVEKWNSGQDIDIVVVFGDEEGETYTDNDVVLSQQAWDLAMFALSDVLQILKNPDEIRRDEPSEQVRLIRDYAASMGYEPVVERAAIHIIRVIMSNGMMKAYDIAPDYSIVKARKPLKNLN